MILRFKCKETHRIWIRERSRRFPEDIQNRALRKLRQLHTSRTLDDLKQCPGSQLESLKGDRIGQMSIRINKKWRICFVWQDPNAIDVEIVDYH